MLRRQRAPPNVSYDMLEVIDSQAPHLVLKVAPTKETVPHQTLA